jgi:hypothetical protein
MQVCSVNSIKKVRMNELPYSRIKLFIFILLGFFLVLHLVSAEVQTLGVFKVGSCISLTQICADCTYNNITSVTAPDSTQVLSQSVMTRAGTTYNKTFCNTGQQGNYIVSGVGDLGGTDTIWTYDFQVTPSGFSNLLGLFILVSAIIYAIGFIGFFGKNVWVSVLGGLALISLGLFTLLNGVDVYRSFITEAFSFITIGLGAIFSITAGVELIQEELNYN